MSEESQLRYQLSLVEETVSVLRRQLAEARAARDSAWNAAIMTAATAVEDTDVVEATGTMGSYYAQLGDARATLTEAAKNVRALRTSCGLDAPGDEGRGDRG